jgi:DNA replication protein DnaC
MNPQFFKGILDEFEIIDDDTYDKREQEKYERKQQGLAQERLRQIPKRYKDSTFDNFQGNDKLVEYMKTGKSAIICGSNGTGKTHIAFASLRYQIEQGRDAHYILAADYFDQIKTSFADGSSASILRRYANYDYLIIDEMDKAYGTQTEFVYLYRMINERYNEMLHTVVITNANMQNAISVIGASVFDRIAGDGKVIELTGESRRKGQYGVNF